MPRRPGPRAGGQAVAALLYGGTTAAALLAPRLKRRLARRLPEALADTIAGAALVAAGWTTIAVTERLRPFDPDWNRSRDDVAADAYSLVLGGGGSQVLGLLYAPVAEGMLGRATLARPLARLPLAARLAVTLSAYDLGHAAHHRFAHETAYWRVHSVHHSATRLYWFNATRFHPLELAVDSVLEATILALLGVDADTRLAHRVFRGIYGQIQHGNVDLDSGPANAVLSTPERHRWHHSTDPAEGNSNYGAVVAVWDRAWGTDFLPERPFDAEIGIDMPAFPADWFGQALAPFRWEAVEEADGTLGPEVPAGAGGGGGAGADRP